MSEVSEFVNISYWVKGISFQLHKYVNISEKRSNQTDYQWIKQIFYLNISDSEILKTCGIL